MSTTYRADDHAQGIRARYKARVMDVLDLPTQLDNQLEGDGTGETFKKPDDAPWCRLNIRDGETEIIDLAQKRYRQVGVVIFQVFVPIGEGDARARDISRLIREAFSSVTEYGVKYRAASARRVGESDGELQFNVSVPFQFEYLIP